MTHVQWLAIYTHTKVACKFSSITRVCIPLELLTCKYYDFNNAIFYLLQSSYQGIGDPNQNHSEPDIDLDCGRPVSFSYYDDLIGISLRYSHPMVADPEVS